MMRFIFCAAILLVLLGCGDLIPVIPPLTISGHLFKYCGGEPVTTGTLTILSPFGSTLATDIPDASGFFNLEYKGTASRIVYDDNIGFSGEEIYAAGPSGSIESGDLGNFYLNNKGSIRVKLKVISPKTSSDTLLLRAIGIAEDVKIPGPFVDGIVHTFENIQMSNTLVPCLVANSECENCTQGGLAWELNKVGNNLFANGVQVGLCGCGQVNEVEIVIE
jgi:hypothetical protein